MPLFPSVLYIMPNQEVVIVQQQEFHKLASLAGITLSPKILRIVLELLELNVDPVTVHELLRKIFSRQRSNQSRGSSRSGNARKSSHSSDASHSTRQEVKKRPM